MRRSAKLNIRGLSSIRTYGRGGGGAGTLRWGGRPKIHEIIENYEFCPHAVAFDTEIITL
jgi:hypothetical protein